MLPNLLTLAEAAKRLRCSESYLRKIIADKLPDMPPLPVLHIGSKTRICEATLCDWLLQLERKGKEAQNWLKDNDPEDETPEE